MTGYSERLPEELSSTILRGLYRLWNARRGTKRCPRRTDLLPIDMRFTFPSTAVIEVTGQPTRFRFRYANINWVIGGAQKNLAGRYADEITIPGFAEKLLPIWHQVVRTGAPVGIQRGDLPVEIMPAREALILPFATDFVSVDRLMVVLDPQGRMIDPLEDRKSMPRFVQLSSHLEVPHYILRKICEMWLVARTGEGLPPPSFANDPRLLPYSKYLINIVFDSETFEFRYEAVGEAINRAHGIALDGKRFGEALPANILVEVVAVLDHCLECSMPALGRGHRVFDGVEIGFDVLILPLGNNGRCERFLNVQIFDEDPDYAITQEP